MSDRDAGQDRKEQGLCSRRSINRPNQKTARIGPRSGISLRMIGAVATDGGNDPVGWGGRSGASEWEFGKWGMTRVKERLQLFTASAKEEEGRRFLLCIFLCVLHSPDRQGGRAGGATTSRKDNGREPKSVNIATV